MTSFAVRTHLPLGRYRWRSIALGVMVAGLFACSQLAWQAAVARATAAQLTVMEDNGRLHSPDPAVRNATLDEMRRLGVDVVRVSLIWRTIAPGADLRSPPAGFDGTDSGGYGAGWAQYVDVVNEIRARGMEPWLAVTAPAPRWAAPKRAIKQDGVYTPDPVEFGKFARAAGSVFSLVDKWSIYNEPNHRFWLEPQVKVNGVIFSARHYRKLYAAAYDGLVAAGHGSAQIYFGELAPRAKAATRGAPSTRPVAWLRELFCLDAKLKPFRGREVARHGCKGFKPLKAYGFAYHPYTEAVGPLRSDPDADDAPIINMWRIYRVLDRAAALRRLTKRRIPVYNSEFAFQSNPPDPLWTKLRQVPLFLNVSEYLSYLDRRLGSYSQYQLFDEPLTTSFPSYDPRRYGGFQSGLRFANGEEKPGVYDAFRLPIIVTRLFGSKVEVWGGIRTTTGANDAVEIQHRTGGGSFTTLRTVMMPSAGYFRVKLSVPGGVGSRDTFRLRWNGDESRVAKAGKKIRPSKEPGLPG